MNTETPDQIPASPACTATAAPANYPPAAGTVPSNLGNVPAATDAGGNETSVPNDAAVLSADLLARSVALFGQAEVMPYEPSRFPDYFQKLLERLKTTCQSDIVGVACNATTNLCALVLAFDNITESQWFVQENSWLISSMCTTWNNKMFLIWLKMTGWRPPNCILPGGGVLITNGILPAVEIAGAAAYSGGFPDEKYGKAIKQIEFTEFAWPPNLLEVFLLWKLESQFGPLIYTNDSSNRPVLNVATAARFFITRLNLRYLHQTDSFTLTDAEGLAGLARQDLAALILDWLGKKTASAGIAAPGDAVVADVISEIIKITAIGAQEGLRRFLNKYVERRTAGSVTMAELLAAYQCTCEEEGAAMLPARKFYKEITDTCRRRYGVAKSHDIRRRSLAGKETAKSGFRNLSLKFNSPDTPDASETSDTSDASSGLAK
jgi:hypothetical protein